MWDDDNDRFDKVPVLSPSRSNAQENLIDLDTEVEKLQHALPQATTRERALEIAIRSAELSMNALKLADGAELRSTYNAQVKTLLQQAERIKTGPDWNSPPKSKPLLSAGTQKAQPPNVKRLKEPVSTRQKAKNEEIIILKNSWVNGFKFVPWDGPPSDVVFELDHEKGLFLDTPELKLSRKQMEVFGGWKRAEEALPPPTWISEENSQAGPSMTFAKKVDLVQDAATDCSVVASLCAGTARAERGHPKLLSSIIFPYDTKNSRPAISANGRYIVRLNFNGTYRRVDIDDRLPVSKTSRFLHVIDRHNPGLLWPALMEKAYLKVRGGYDFPGSNSGTDLWILTGWIPEQLFLQSDDIMPNAIWKRIFKAHSFGDVLITIGTGKMSKREEREIGLAGEHDYAVLDMREVDGQKLMLIKNPWCEGTSWRGSTPKLNASGEGNLTADNHDDDDDPLPSSRDLLNADAQLSPGTFWMDLNSILQHFESIYLNWNPGLFKYRQDLHFRWDLSPNTPAAASRGRYSSLSNNPQFSVSVEDGGTAWLLLSRHFQDPPGESASEHHQTNAALPLGFISLYAFDTSGTRVMLSDGALTRGPFVDSPQTLLRLDNLVSNRPYTIVAMEEDLPSMRNCFTLSTWANSKIQIDHAMDRYPHQVTVNSCWTKETAGGATHSPLYAQNPQFAIVVPSRTPISLLVQTATDHLNVHTKLVHGRGQRVHSLRKRDVVFDSRDYRRGCALAELSELDPGTYTIICSTFEAGQLGDFSLRVDSTVPVHLTQLAKEGAGRINIKLAPATFLTGDRKVVAPLVPRRLAKVMVSVKHKPTTPVPARSTPRRECSLIRVSIERGVGPHRQFVITSGNGDYADSANGMRTEEVDVNPTMAKNVGMWLVIERMSTPRENAEEQFEVDLFCDVPDAIGVGVWRAWEE